MSKHQHHPTSKILSYRKYWTFQGYYRVISRDGNMSPTEVFSKCVLHITKWLKDRSDYPEKDSEFDFLTYYREPHEYKAFSEYFLEHENTLQQETYRDYIVNIFASKEERTWTARIEEPDNARETSDFLGRIFITNISVKHQDDEVLIGIRVTCKEPSNNKSEAAAFRPACLYYIYEDESLAMFEGAVKSNDYRIDGEIINLNTGSESDCKKIYDDLITSDNRQMPIIICPSINDDNMADNFEKLAGRYAGQAYFIRETQNKNYAKLFMKVMKNGLMPFKLIESAFICYLPKRGFGEKSKEGELKPFSANEKGLEELGKFVSTYTVRRDGFEKTPKIGYGNLLFYSKLKEKHLSDVEEAADIETINELRKQIDLLSNRATSIPEDELDEILRNYRILSLLLSETETHRAEVEKRNKELNGIINQKNEDIKHIKKENEKLKDQIVNLNLQISMYEDIDSDNEILIDDNDIWTEKLPQKNSEVIPWIKSLYSETIIIHPDAEKSFNKLAQPTLNISRFCQAFAFLDIFVRYRSGLISRNYYDLIGESISFKVTPTGFVGSRKDYPAYYVDVDENGFAKNGIFCDLHIKYSSNSNETFRIYFAYLDDLKKAVVGSMPDHLSTGIGDDRNRKNKV